MEHESSETQAQPIDDFEPQVTIPMKRTSPTWLIAGGVGAALVVGLLVFSMSGPSSSNKTIADLEEDDTTETAEQEKEKAKAIREHRAMSQRSLARVKEEKKEQPAAEEKEAEKTASGSAPKSGAGSEKAAPTKAPKKQIQELDSIGADIASQLE